MGFTASVLTVCRVARYTLRVPRTGGEDPAQVAARQQKLRQTLQQQLALQQQRQQQAEEERDRARWEQLREPRTQSKGWIPKLFRSARCCYVAFCGGEAQLSRGAGRDTAAAAAAAARTPHNRCRLVPR